LLNRIDEIRGLGLFDVHTHTPDTDFEDLTLIYGENGCGKSTLAAVLDAVRSSDTDAMLRRARLGGDGKPQTKVTINGTTYRFNGTNWDARPPYNTLDVYFSDFVSRNVYSGESVESDQRRQLCEFALGPRAVALINRLNQATVDSGLAKKEVDRVEGALKKIIKEPHSLKQFEALTESDDVDARLKAAEAKLAAAKRVTEELLRQAPSTVVLPAVPLEAIHRFLAMSTGGIPADAAAAVRAHISDRLDPETGEQWLSDGASHLTDVCPFCAQSVAGVGLVESIATYFSRAYRDYAVSVKDEAQSLRESIGTPVIDALVASLTKEIGIAANWTEQQVFDSVAAAGSVTAATKTWREAAGALGAIVLRKLASPLDTIPTSEADTAIELYREALAGLESVNLELAASEASVALYKKDLQKTDTDRLQADLNKVQNAIARFQPYAVDLLEQWTSAKAKRGELEKLRDELKLEIETQASRVVGDYQKAINYYLKAFGCEMEILGVKHAFPAGKASVSYELRVRGHGVPLAYHSNKPCFKTALSEGDRSSLALAFFLARLKDHSRLDGRTVVLDDPVDSFGNSRRRAVRLAIRDLCARGAQVVVMTHDDRLAAMIWRDTSRTAMAKKQVRTLELVETKSGAAIRPWDVEVATRGQYFSDYMALEDFLDDKTDHSDAARSIRPYLEQRIRFLFPGTSITSRDNLGDMIGKVKNAGRGSRLKALEPRLRDLEELNDASLPSHHASDDVLDMPLPGRKETRRYAELALTVC